MKKRLLITGASGMIGNEILKTALMSLEISEVISLVRRKSTNQNKKLKEFIIKDFTNYSEYRQLFENIDLACFCIGVYTGQVPDRTYKKITVDYATVFAKQLKVTSPNSRLCFLSGAGTDRTEKSKTAFARYKGMAENRIADMNLDFYSFRPGYIYPVTARKEPNLMYKIMRGLYPLVKLFGDKYSITSISLANVMFSVGLQGYDKEILENIDIVNFEKRVN